MFMFNVRKLVCGIAGQSLVPFCESCPLSLHTDTLSSHSVGVLPSDIMVVILCIAVLCIVIYGFALSSSGACN